MCIIDCREIFIERPFNLNARAKTWSNYKHHNTIKYFIGCAPTGAINFISDGWGVDQILADRGFTVAEEVASKGCVLVIHAFTKSKDQLSEQDD